LEEEKKEEGLPTEKHFEGILEIESDDHMFMNEGSNQEDRMSFID
jgi:hypothetical protein